MSKEKVAKYIIELHLIEIEVDADAETEDYWEYDEVSVDIEPISDFNDYDTSSYSQ